MDEDEGLVCSPVTERSPGEAAAICECGSGGVHRTAVG